MKLRPINISDTDFEQKDESTFTTGVINAISSLISKYPLGGDHMVYDHNIKDAINLS